MLTTQQSSLALNNTAPTTEIIRVDTLSWNFFYDQGVQLLHATAQILPTLLLGIILLVLSYLIAGPLSRLLIKPIDYMTDSKLVHLVIRRSISTLIILLGMYLFLRLAGLTQFAVAIMSGTGLIGLIIFKYPMRLYIKIPLKTLQLIQKCAEK